MAPTAFSASAKVDAAALDALIAGAGPRRPAPGLAEAVAALPPGWLLLEGVAPGMPRHLLLHPRHGVALLALQPGAEPGAAAALGEAVAGSGAPPVVLLCLPRRALEGLEAALEQGFADRAPPAGSAWCVALQRRLLAEGLARPVAMPRRLARHRRGWLLAGLALLVVGLASALLLGQPEAMPLPPRLAAPGAQPPWPAPAQGEAMAALRLPPWPARPYVPAALDYAEWPPDPAPPDDGAAPAGFRPG